MMGTSFLLSLAAKSFVSGGLAFLAVRLLVQRSSAERAWLAHIGLFATLVLPLAAIALPAWSLAPAVVADAATPASPSPVALLSGPGQQIANLIDVGRPDWPLMLMLAWAIPAAMMLIALMIAMVRLIVLRHRASVLVETSWLSALAYAQRRMGFKHGTALLVSDELNSPISWGFLRPVILINERIVTATHEAEAIIAHELAHIRRLDWANMLVARLATALFWFNPFIWLLARDAHQLREESADDAVLQSLVDETDYAGLLLEAARHENRALFLAAHGVAPARKSLERRVQRVLDRALKRTPARPRWAAACMISAISVSTPLAAVTLDRTNGNARAEPTHIAELPLGASLPASGKVDAAPGARAFASDSAAPAADLGLSPQRAPEKASIVTSGTTVADLNDRRSSRGDSLRGRDGTTGSPDFLQEMAKLGYGDADPAELISGANVGVTPDYVRGMTALGYRNASMNELSSAAALGITPDYVRKLAALGYRSLTLQRLIALKGVGVTPDYIREAQGTRTARLTEEDLLNLRNADMSLESHRARDGP